jgi:hypothetical protein
LRRLYLPHGFSQSFRGQEATCLVQRSGVSGEDVVGDGRRIIAAMEVLGGALAGMMYERPSTL